MVVSWKGNQSLAWDEIYDLLYDEKYLPRYRHYDHYLSYPDIDRSNFTKVNLLPLDKCTKAENISDAILFDTYENDLEMRVIVSDPNLQPSYRLSMIGIHRIKIEWT